MKYRRYGKTGLEISVLTFGAMRIPFDEAQCPAAERTQREENAVATMRRAMELGINHVDTARGYGNSERLVGLGLKELGRDKFYVTTKIGIQPSADEAAKQIDEALAKMGIDHVDVVDLHGVNTSEKMKTAIDPNGCIKGVQAAIAEGKVGHAAFSAHQEPAVIVPTMESGLFEAVSLHHLWTHQSNGESIRRAKELDIGVLILSPSEKGGQLFRPTKKLSEVCAPFTPLVLANRWLLAQPGVTTLSVGAANPSEFDAHMPVADEPDAVTAEEEAALARWTQAEIAALGATRCTLCGKCMPCPRNVAIVQILRMRNLLKAFDMKEFGVWRYNLLESGGDWFPGEKADKCNRCGDCLPQCPEKLDIPELLEETHALLLDKPRKRLWGKE